jgi:hypothetical protein
VISNEIAGQTCQRTDRMPSRPARTSNTEFSTGPVPDLQRRNFPLRSSLCRRYRGASVFSGKLAHEFK